MEVKFQLIMNKDGSLIDRDASMSKFQWYLTGLCTNQEQEQEKIAEAVSVVFDALDGKRASKKYVIGLALNKTGLMVAAENHSILYARVDNYLKRNTGEGKIFNVDRSGIGRVSDMAK